MSRALALAMRFAALAAVAVLSMMAMVASALAAPAWRIDSLSNTTAQPGDILDYRVQITNVGDAAMDGSTISLVVTLPRGLNVADPAGPVSSPSNPHFAVNGLNFQLLQRTTPSVTPCTRLDGTPLVGGESQVRCESTESTPAAGTSNPWQLLFLPVDVAPDATGTLITTAEVSGGGAPAARTVDPTIVTSGPPGFGLDAFDGEVVDAAGNAYTQAGGHPYAATVSTAFNTRFDPAPLKGLAWPVEPVKDLLVDLPPGFVGDPTAAAKCTNAELAVTDAATGGSALSARPTCAADSQVGTVVVRINSGPAVLGPLPVFNMVPPPNVPARFGFNLVGSVVVLDAALRSGGDYGLTVKAENIPQALAIASTTLTFWGVPSDASHDIERACPGQPAPLEGGESCGSGAQRRAFLRNPTSCPEPGVGLVTTARLDSWEDPGDFKQVTWVSHDQPGYPSPLGALGAPIGPTGCASVPFNPEFGATPAAPAKPASPSGFTFDLTLPPSDDPTAIGQSDLRKAVVTLPAGVRVSPSSAHGLGACSSAQIRLHADSEPSCPDSSRIGSVTIDTPLLDDPLAGSVYLASPHDNPFDSLLAVYIVAHGPGVVVKLPGRVEADAQTGQLTATFDDNPQLPFSKLHVEFNSGSTAPLVTPKECGTYTTQSVLTSWSGKTVPGSSTFKVSGDGRGGPCAPPQFKPALDAGVVNPVAGGSSSFTLRVQRDDVDDELKTISTTLPPGLLAKVAGIARCGEADAAAGTCSAASRIGSVTVGAGAGSNPFYINNGKAYLTEGYKGAPFGLAISVPAVAGPFDLGVVTVRAALRIDPVTAQATVEADPMPRILQGIPLQVRDIRVDVDRPGFMRNPTSCAPSTIAATLTSFADTAASLSNRFEVGDCASLALKPKLAIALTGKGQSTDGKHPGVHATVSQSAGQANLKKVVVSLPLSLALDPDNANGLCEFADGSKVEPTCPKASIVGRATARTPILGQPLTGPVFFVKNIRKDARTGREIRTLPKLVIPLTGENGLRLNLVGTSNVVNDRLVTTFDNIPDAPVSDFTLDIAGGKSGILVVSGTDVCKATQVADQQIDGQNGRTADADVYLQTSGCPLKIISKKAGKTSVAVKIGGLGAGKVTVTGKGIKKTSKTISKSTVATITAKRSKGKPGKVTVSFDPAGPAKVRKTSR